LSDGNVMSRVVLLDVGKQFGDGCVSGVVDLGVLEDNCAQLRYIIDSAKDSVHLRKGGCMVVICLHVVKSSMGGAMKARVVANRGVGEAYLVDGCGSGFDGLCVGGAQSK
jgi:hypothetical protein